MSKNEFRTMSREFCLSVREMLMDEGVQAQKEGAIDYQRLVGSRSQGAEKLIEAKNCKRASRCDLGALQSKHIAARGPRCPLLREEVVQFLRPPPRIGANHLSMWRSRHEYPQL